MFKMENIEEINFSLDEQNECDRSIHATRNSPLFDIFRSPKSRTSPLLQILKQMNAFSEHFGIDESIQTTKVKLKQFF